MRTDYQPIDNSKTTTTTTTTTRRFERPTLVWSLSGVIQYPSDLYVPFSHAIIS
jgi:hypothetical protein